jgi:DNA-directed RNA polymerase specialized sigma24 family protein
MGSEGSIARWVALLRVGDEQAAQQVWERYFDRLARLARTKLAGLPRRASDEEDVVLSALDSFFRDMRDPGRFPQLKDEKDLWRVLVLITAGKATDLIKRERRQKRGGGKVLDEAAFDSPDASQEERALAQIISKEPTPEFAALFAEKQRQLVEMLDDSQRLRTVAQLHLFGHSSAEIASQLRCSDRTVQRKLEVIRELWARRASG